MFFWKPLFITLATLMSAVLLVVPVEVAGDMDYLQAVEKNQKFMKQEIEVDSIRCDSQSEKIIRRAFEDNSWLALSTKKELRAYCEAIYCPDAVNEMVAKLFKFIQGNSDWHTGARVRSINEIYRNNEEMQAKVSIEYIELGFSENSQLSFVLTGEDNFLVLLKKTEDGYKIKEISRQVEEKKR